MPIIAYDLITMPLTARSEGRKHRGKLLDAWEPSLDLTTEILQF